VRAIVVRCPNCGANLKIEHTVTSVKCSYCEVVSRIQPRTKILQVPVHVPAPPRHQPAMPVARQKFSWLAMLPFLVIVGAIASGIVFSARVQQQQASKMMWAGRAPVLLDVDGDGVLDAVGVVRYVLDDDRAHLAAYSGKTGAQLWQSESLGKYGELGQQVMAATRELVLIASDRGTLAARDRAGKPVWQLTFDEKLDELCAGTAPDEIIVATADQRWFAIDGKGNRREAPALRRLDRSYTDKDAWRVFESVGAEASPGVCRPIDNVSWTRAPGLLATRHWHDHVELPNIRVDHYLRRPGGPIVAFGSKTPGTAVPMLARIEGKAARWTIQIPATDPLVSRAEARHVTLSDREAIVVYQPKSPEPMRLTAFDLETGERRWDRALQKDMNLSGLVVAGELVLVADWIYLRAYALADGSERFVIGER
jgi:outer membrane protein assembly factor BamB